MSSKANVTTPGGFFVGLGGIMSFCVVGALVFLWVKKPVVNDEFRPQQIALGLRAADDAKGDDISKKKAETTALLTAAAMRYNAGTKPDLDKIDDLRGVIRYREAQKSIAESGKALTGAATWKDKAKGEVTMPVDLAMKVVANGMKDRKPKASAVKVDMMPVVDPNAAPILPNAMGGGAKTVIFADPNAVTAPAPTTPPTAPAPVTPAVPTTPAAAPAPASPGASLSSPPPAVAVAAPARPTLLNWSESKK